MAKKFLIIETEVFLIEDIIFFGRFEPNKISTNVKLPAGWTENISHMLVTKQDVVHLFFLTKEELDMIYLTLGNAE